MGVARHQPGGVGVTAARLGTFDRVFDLFDGNDESAVIAARERWTEAKRAGHTLAYWQQTAGGWEKATSSRSSDRITKGFSPGLKN